MSGKENAILSTLCWVNRGFSKAQLQEYQPTQEELEDINMTSKKLMKGGDIHAADLEDAAKQIEANMEDSDDDTMPHMTSELEALKKNEEKTAAKEAAMEDDEDAVMNDDHPSQFSDSEEEKDDYLIRKSDSLIVAATAEGDHSNLEVYLYDHKTSDMYVHHEIILGAYPLCMEWMGYQGGQQVNNVIVGTFMPEIEIWDLNKESVEPAAILGDMEKGQSKKYVKKFKKGEDIGTHTDAVMCLSLNPFQKEYLASGSGDTTVRIWDLDDLQCKATFTDLHKDKVQAVRWNLKNEQTLLSAGYDSRVNIFDVRDQSSKIRAKIPKDCKDIESATWHTTQEHNFAVSTESGVVLGYDTRKIDEPVFRVHAHDGACSNVSFSAHIPNMMATSGTDQHVRIWDISTGASPSKIVEKDMKQGELLTLQFCQDIPWVLATGGSKGSLAVWDTCENKIVEEHFKKFLVQGSYDLADYNPDEPRPEADEDGFEDVEDSEEEEEEKPKKKSKKAKKAKKED